MPDNCAVKVAVRERPLGEFCDESSVISYHDSHNILIVDERPFFFDHILGPTVTQEQLFDDLIKPLVGKVKQGFNCTALAYGQTGTGKSYTMGLNLNSFAGDNVGVIPRCLREIFHTGRIDENLELEPPRDISASFIEIYNEKVYDLLAENSTEPIVARGYKFTGGTRKSLTNLKDCNSILLQGNKNRHVRPTKMNSQSSRSHAIFTIHIRSCSGDPSTTTSSCLNLVDLAGSEGVRRTGHKGMAMSEGVHINQGLLSIGKVLQAMTLGNKVIPYRDSVLSSVLQDSLNPNSYLTLLACVSPQRVDMSETLSTLRFAQNAKQLKHSPKINTIMSEIKKNKAKTPYKVNSTISRLMPITPNPLKRPFTNTNSVVMSGTKSISAYSSATYHSQTFCTPSKVKRFDTNKFNQTEMGMTPKEKQKSQMTSMPPSILKPPPPIARQTLMYPFELSNNRESLFDHTIDSRASLMSLNMSTSTALDVPIQKSSTSFSPVVRKCVKEIETKMLEMFENFKESQEKNATLWMGRTANNVTCTPMQQDNHNQSSQLPSSIRKELKSIMQELMNQKAASAQTTTNLEDATKTPDSLTPVNQNVACQLFATSSPVFKVPDVPEISKSHKTMNYNLDTSNDTVLSISEEHEYSSFVFNVDQTKKPVRRSRRISEFVLNQTSNDDSLVASSTIHRRPSTRKSLKTLHEARRRSIRLAAHLEVNEPPLQVEQATLSKSHKKLNKTTLTQNIKSSAVINNSVIASYFDDNCNNSSSSKSTRLSKHQKAILDMLNTAPMKGLQVLPQIGAKTAYQIMTHRTLNGKFKSLKQVEKLPIWRGRSWERFAEANMLQ